MNYKNLGNTGLKVSPLCLGCMTFGVPERGDHPWTLPESQSRPLIRKAIDLGINFFDTANAYSDGTSEEIVGQALRDYSRRDEVVIATKVFFPPARSRTSEVCRARPSLDGHRRPAAAARHRRCGSPRHRSMGLPHADRGDARGAARHGEVGQGALPRRVEHVRVAVHARCLATRPTRTDGRVRRACRIHYNLIYREEEREMLPLCADAGIAVLPWSPLARGRLTREWNTETERTRTDVYGEKLFPSTGETDRKVVEAVAAVASARGVPRAQVALSWLIRRPGVRRHRSSAPRKRSIWTMPPRHWRSSSPPTRRRGSNTPCSARGDRARMSAPACAIP